MQRLSPCAGGMCKLGVLLHARELPTHQILHVQTQQSACAGLLQLSWHASPDSGTILDEIVAAANRTAFCGSSNRQQIP